MKNLLRNLSLAALAGVLGGLTTSLFLMSLDWVVEKQRLESALLYFLPIAGLLIGGLYDRFGRETGNGAGFIIDEIHSPSLRIPGRTTPLIFFTTLLSHLFGASMGREGAAIQMGSSTADQLGRFFHLSNGDRRILLKAGAAAGFAGALGTPIAGLIFGMEFITKTVRFRVEHLAECAVAAYLALTVHRVLGVSHFNYGVLPDIPFFSVSWVAAAGAFGGLTGGLVRLFIALTELLTFWNKKISAHISVRAFFGGFILIFLSWILGNRDSFGLGLPAIEAALKTPSPYLLAFEKILTTAVSVASGFRGGEFVPLVFIGATGMSAIANLFSVPTAFAAVCGIASSFGSAARVPFALSVFAAEQFSPRFFIYALIANATARLVVGGKSDD